LWVMSCPCISKSGIDYESDLSNYGTCWINFDMPLAEIVFDFMTVWKRFQRICFVWLCSYWDANFKLSKVDILLNATVVDALSLLIHVDNAYHIGKKMCEN
jgi:GTP-binding protein LepA